MLKVLPFFALLFCHLATAGTLESEESTSLLKLEEPAINAAVHLPGMSYHFQEPTEKGQHWNQMHSGIGLEWQHPRKDEVSVKYSVGLLRDSVAQWGGYAAAVWQAQLWDSHPWRLEAGGGMFLFYRALDFDGPRRLVPAPLPVVSLLHRSSGMGLNVLYVPRVTLKSEKLPAVLFAQVTKQF